MSDWKKLAGAVLMVGFDGALPEDRIRVLGPAGVILFGRNLESAERTRDLVGRLRGLLPGPPLLALDQEGGRVSRLEPFIGPTPTAAALAFGLKDKREGAKVAVFVDGCFWHGCPDHYVRPRSSAEFWAAKLAQNVWRDVEQTRRLERLGQLVESQGQGFLLLSLWLRERCGNRWQPQCNRSMSSVVSNLATWPWSPVPVQSGSCASNSWSPREFVHW